jgi:DNA-binding GntR family transcriptional regulator
MNDSSRARVSRGSGVQKVYTSLKSDILEMRLPPGFMFDESSLSSRFELSRTPIREALVRLAAEGLVTTLPNRSTIVSIIDFAELPVYFEALTLMHRVTTRSAALCRTDSDLEMMRQHQTEFADAVAQHDAPRMLASNRELHVAIAEAGRNKYFTGLFARLLDEGRRILRLYYASFDDRLPLRYVEEHEQIIDAIEKGEAERADILASQHAAQIVKQIQSFLDRRVGSTLPLDPQDADIKAG